MSDGRITTSLTDTMGDDVSANQRIYNIHRSHYLWRLVYINIHSFIVQERRVIKEIAKNTAAVLCARFKVKKNR